MNSSDFDFQITQIDSIESTNIYAHKLLTNKNVHEGYVIQSNFQTKGKGQQGQNWESESGKNLLFSIVVKPNLKVEDQFALSKVVSLSLKNYLDSLSVGNVNIKWPNDLLVEDKKIAGILIENSVYGYAIKSAVIGIGINVNQLNFNSYNRKATSLALLTGNYFDLNQELKSFLTHFKRAYTEMQSTKNVFDAKYLEGLYGFGKPLNYRDNEGEFQGVILSVLPDGKLQLNRNGRLKAYDLKELSFLD